MATRIENMGLTRPDPRSVRWSAYIAAVREYWLAEADTVSRPTTVFVAANGSDANDGLSEAAPKLTLSAAVAACSANYNLSLRRGDKWLGETLGQITLAGIKITAHGTGDRPLVSNFIHQWEAGVGAWTLHSDGGTHQTYYAAAGTNFSRFFRRADERFRPFFPRTTVASAEGGARRFRHETSESRIYITVEDGVDPDDYAWDASDGDEEGLSLTGDLSIAEHLDIEGFCDTSNVQGCGIRIQPTADELIVVRYCRDTYSYSHAMHQWNSSSTSTVGGLGLFYKCQAGFLREKGTGTAAENLFNTYTGGGGQQTVYDDCDAMDGAITDNSTSPQGGIFGGHSAGTSGQTQYSVDQCHFHNIRVWASENGWGSIGSVQDPSRAAHTAATVGTHPYTLVNIQFGYDGYGLGLDKTRINQPVLNSNRGVHVRWSGKIGVRNLNTRSYGIDPAGYLCSSQVLIDFSEVSYSDPVLGGNPSASNLMRPELDYCTLTALLTSTHSNADFLNYDGTGNWGDGVFRNCEFYNSPDSAGNDPDWNTSGGSATWQNVLVYAVNNPVALEAGISLAPAYREPATPHDEASPGYRVEHVLPSITDLTDVFGNIHDGSIGAVSSYPSDVISAISAGEIDQVDFTGVLRQGLLKEDGTLKSSLTTARSYLV